MKLQISGAQGLVTDGRRLGTGNEGCLVDTDNVFVENGIVVPRYGLEATTNVGTATDRFYWDPTNNQVVRGDTTTDGLAKYVGPGWTNLDTTRTYNSLTPMRGYSWALSDEGLMRIDFANTGVEIGHIPEGLDISYTLSGSSGWMPNGSQTAYVVVWGLIDSKNQLYLGAPGGRLVVTNSAGGTRDVALTFTVPSVVTTSYFFQIYRTRPSAGSTIDPGAEYFLVYENKPTSGEITARLITFTDGLPDGAGGSALYTNESQQTDAQQNFPCEAAQETGAGELAPFADCMWASRYNPRARLQINLLGVLSTNGLNARGGAVGTLTGDFTISTNTILNVSSTTGLAIGMRVTGASIAASTTITNVSGTTVTMSNNATATNATQAFEAGDIITIDGVQYYAWESENIAAREFAVSTNASAAIAIRDTAESLIRVFNRSTSTVSYYMRYLSGPNQLPGQILVYARTIRATVDTVQASSHGTAWEPNLTTAQNIVSEEDFSSLVYSKPNEPMAWPLPNRVRLTNDAIINKIVPLRGALMVFTDRGLYRVSGVYGNFRLDLLDESVSTIGSFVDSAAVLDGVVYAYTTRGLMAGTESGVQNISESVYNSLIFTGAGSVFVDSTLGYVYLNSHQNTFVYHTRSGVWTRWDTEYVHGVTHKAFRQMMLNRSNGQPYLARSTTVEASLCYDSTLAVTVSSVVVDTVTLNAALSAIQAGDVLVQGGRQGSITSATVAGSTTVLETVGLEPGSYSTGAATVRHAYDCRVVYCPVGQPALAQTMNIRSANVLFDHSEASPTNPVTYNNSDFYRSTTLSAKTNLYPTGDTKNTVIAVPDLAHLARFYMPAQTARASLFVLGTTIRSVNWFGLTGLELDYETVSERSTRNR